MRWEQLFKVALKSLGKNRMRSLLTSLGIIIGVGAVIVMVAIGQGSQSQIEKSIGSLGANMIVIFPGTTQVGRVSQGEGTANRITLADADMLTRDTTLCNAISPVVSTRSQVIGGNNNWNTTITGVSTSYLTIRAWPLESGDFFTDRDIRTSNKVAVLGKTVANNLFPGQDPVGQRIRIRNTPFKVIGVLTVKGQDVSGRDSDDIILAPDTTVFFRLVGGRYINMILASAISREVLPQAQKELEGIMREAHKIPRGSDNDFTIRNQAEITEAASATSKVMTLLLGSIAGVSLIVGGIGIMNIMLVSVTERTREIGIRLAVGARSIDVLTQFLMEAVVLSLIGGFLGILIAFGISEGMNRFTSIPTVINPGIVALAALFSAGVGIFFGFYPARKAASLNPIDALRYE
jgi:putative ABC transport system permease protein